MAANQARKSEFSRKTSETNIDIDLCLDGSGKSDVNLPVPFMSHMVDLMARHGLFDISVTATGDVEIDAHHTVEDLGICLGEVLKKAMGDKAGIRRYGNATIPMHETLAEVNIDLSGRPYLVFNANIPKAKIGEFDAELIEEFFVAFCNHSGANLHINLRYGSNLHHMAEGIFKAFARALDMATSHDPRIDGVMSSKGKLE